MYSSRDGAQSDNISLSIFADDGDVRAQLVVDAELAGFYPILAGSLSDLLHDPDTPLGECALLHCDELDAVDCGALLTLDRRLEDHRVRVVVSTSPEGLEDIYACIKGSHPSILVAPSRGERMVALGMMMGDRQTSGVRELDEGDRLTLLRLTEQVAQIAAQIDRLSEGPPAFRLESPADEFRAEGEAERQLIRAPRPPLPDPRLVRKIIRQRQLRAQFLGKDLFADPAWDILLDLTAARAEHSRVSVTSLCIASGVPPTTALRWISQMTEAGLLERVEDDSDRRRAFIQLSEKAADALARYFAELGKDAKSLV